MIADLKAQNEGVQAELADEINERASELKAKADKAAKEVMSSIESWIDSFNTKVDEFTQVQAPEIPEMIALA